MIERMEQFAYIFLLITVGLLISTGFIPLLFGGIPTGYILLLHVLSAGWFLVTIAVYVILHSPSSLMLESRKDEDWPYRIVLFIESLLFMLMVALSVVLILSIVTSMTKWFGSEEQIQFVFVHRVSAILFTIVFVSHAAVCYVFRKQRALRRFYYPFP